jgi:hypothetical protein
MSKSVVAILVVSSALKPVSTSPASLRSRTAPTLPHITEPPSYEGLDKRQAPIPVKTCGYGYGDSNDPRIADPSYGYRVDSSNGLWGFGPTTVISAKDCGLVGMCVDSHSCTPACGRLFNRPDITTFQWLVTLLHTASFP